MIIDHEAIFLKSQGEAILRFAMLILLVVAVASSLVALGYAMAAWGAKYTGPDAEVHAELLQAKKERMDVFLKGHEMGCWK